MNHTDESEHCPEGHANVFPGNGSRNHHGVPMEQRRNYQGKRFRPDLDTYQEGECEYCGITVYSTQNTNKYADPLYHPWRTKTYTIQEEPDVGDLLHN
jgi:hypothetical protein